MNVSEIFTTIQGEGPLTGVPSLFVRFSGCNLRCEWQRDDGTRSRCDTPYASWEPEQNILGMEELVARCNDVLARTKIKQVVLTGGEPMLVSHLDEFCKSLQNSENLIFCVETNGTLPRIIPSIAMFSISPKINTLENNRTNKEWVRNIAELIRINKDAVFYVKLVAGTLNHVENCKDFFKEMENQGISVPHGIMPEGVTREQIETSTNNILDELIRSGIHFCDRLHVRIWGGKRGV
jgi:7-carboxy-7-deazaguanine synthase